jgi:adenylate cyclase
VPTNVIQTRSPSPRRLRFGFCVLDEALGSLTAPDGAQTVLRPKTLELLCLMLGSPGRVIARSEILDTVWPGLFVTDDSITQCVVEIRKAMGAGGTELLKTIPRRGYLLQAEVAMEPPPAGASSLPLLSPRADDRPSIAVLPFRRDVQDPQEAYFSDGIIEGIVHVLSGLDGLFVVSRGSALTFAQDTTDLRAAGERLGVRYVLYGGVRRAGGRLRITTELTDAGTGRILRSDRYDGAEADLFDLQDRIAEQVVAALAPEVRAEEVARALRKPPSDQTAYDLVLRALDEMSRMDRASLLRAQALLEQASARDPGYALAHCNIAFRHALWVAQGFSQDVAADAEASARAAAAALDRDGRDGMAMALRAIQLGYLHHDFAQARELLDKAVSASPSCALAWSYGALVRCWRGEGEEAVRCAERAVRLAPMDSFTFLHQHSLAQANYTVGNLDAAIEWARRSSALNGQHAPNWRLLLSSLAAAGRVDGLSEARQSFLAVEPDFSLRRFLARTPLRGEIRERFAAGLRLAGLPA